MKKPSPCEKTQGLQKSRKMEGGGRGERELQTEGGSPGVLKHSQGGGEEIFATEHSMPSPLPLHAHL